MKSRSHSETQNRSRIIKNADKIKLIVKILTKLHKISKHEIKDFDKDVDPNKFETELKYFK